MFEDIDSKTSTSSLSPPSSRNHEQGQINVDDAFRDRRVISVSIDSCSDNESGITRGVRLRPKEDEIDRSKSAFQAKEEKSECKAPGHVKTHRIVINLDDKNRFTDEVTV